VITCIERSSLALDQREGGFASTKATECEEVWLATSLGNNEDTWKNQKMKREIVSSTLDLEDEWCIIPFSNSSKECKPSKITIYFHLWL